MSVKMILSEKGGEVFSMPPTATISEVSKELSARRIGAVLIMDGDSLVGILSERDVVRVIASEGAAALNFSASRVMTHSVQTCTTDDLIENIMERMTDARFRHMPVLDEGRVVGVISIGDVVKRRIEQAVRESDHLKQYIHSN